MCDDLGAIFGIRGSSLLRAIGKKVLKRREYKSGASDNELESLGAFYYSISASNFEAM
jgi:hypothetical protein